jgi:hypothetical protein
VRVQSYLTHQLPWRENSRAARIVCIICGIIPRSMRQICMETDYFIPVGTITLCSGS